MNLSRRERYIVLATLLTVGIFLFDRYALTPFLEERRSVQSQTGTISEQLRRADRLFVANRRQRPQWEQWMNAGLKDDASAAESRALNALRSWAAEAGLALSSLKPDRPEVLNPPRASGVAIAPARQEAIKQFQQITFRASATGNLSSITRFLRRVETASIPLRITDLQLNSRRDGVDDLTVNVAISTLFVASQPKAKEQS